MHTNILIEPIPILKDNYVWAIINKLDNSVYVVDPGDATPVLAYLADHRLNLAGILITHHHWDHTNGIAGLIQNHPVPVYGPAVEKIAHVTHPLKDADQINLPALQFKVISIPGHTLGHIAYYAPGVLFCGDTLFAAGCGRIFEGTASQMYDALQKISALPDDTKIYCAHEYTLNNLRFAACVEPSNVEINKRIRAVTLLRQQNLPSLPSVLFEEKKTNPFLRCDQPEIFENVRLNAGFVSHEPVMIFEHLRKWKDNF